MSVFSVSLVGVSEERGLALSTIDSAASPFDKDPISPADILSSFMR